MHVTLFEELSLHRVPGERRRGSEVFVRDLMFPGAEFKLVLDRIDLALEASVLQASSNRPQVSEIGALPLRSPDGNERRALPRISESKTIAARSSVAIEDPSEPDWTTVRPLSLHSGIQFENAFDISSGGVCFISVSPMKNTNRNGYLDEAKKCVRTGHFPVTSRRR
jgi:hypothetical protein